MPAYEDSRSVLIHASPEQCFAVLTDYASMPRWQSRVCESRVIEQDVGGRGTLVQYAIDARLRVVRYRLRHRYAEPNWIGSEYAGGDFKDFGGEYRLQRVDGQTCATFQLRIDPGFRIPGPIARMLRQAVMARSLQDLKQRVEEVSNSTQ
jgi:ribosome-associated toxin RatA of RatAB toxin-antitoxin module